MYNTRSSGGGNHNNQRNNQYARKVETYRQQQLNLHPQSQQHQPPQLQQPPQQQQHQPPQQQQQIPNVATFVTQKSPGQTQIDHQNHSLTKQNVSIHNTLSLLDHPCVETPTTQFSEITAPDTLQDDKNSLIKSDTAQTTEETTNVKTEIKWPPKRKINKKEQKKRLNARMRRLVCPKSPLMVFSELYKEVPIKLQERPTQSYIVYTASIEIDGQVYTGDHVSKTQAKQKACENFLRVMLAKKMNERPEKKEENFSETEMEGSENGSLVKSKGPPQEDFPWPHFASLAMHNLIAHWDLQPVTKPIQEETSNKIPVKVSGMKKFPDNPENYNPVQLLHQMKPGTKFSEKIYSGNPVIFEISCEMNGVSFSGQGTTKKAAKKECAIATIKHLWNFDFHNIAINPKV